MSTPSHVGRSIVRRIAQRRYLPRSEKGPVSTGQVVFIMPLLHLSHTIEVHLHLRLHS